MTIDKTKLIDAIFETGGHVSRTAELIGCSSSTIYNHQERCSEVAAAISDARTDRTCEFLDMAEHKLYEAVEAGYFPAIKYVLSTLGKSRGYTERTEVEHSGQAKQIIVNMDLTLPDEDDEIDE